MTTQHTAAQVAQAQEDAVARAKRIALEYVYVGAITAAVEAGKLDAMDAIRAAKYAKADPVSAGKIRALPVGAKYGKASDPIVADRAMAEVTGLSSRGIRHGRATWEWLFSHRDEIMAALDAADAGREA